MTATVWAVLISIGNIVLMITLARGLAAVRANGGKHGRRPR